MLTNGYDYVFALSREKVNSILSKNLANRDIQIQYSGNDPDSGSMIAVNCSLSPWQLVPGGGGTLLNFELPISSGPLSITGGGTSQHNLRSDIH